MTAGLTLDTGALIAMERGERRMARVWSAAVRLGLTITVPAPVVAEWWRGQRGPLARLLDDAVVEPLDRAMAERVGAILRRMGRKGPRLVDVVVVTSAALRGDVVYTSDIGVLEIVRDAMFPSVRLMGLGG